MPTVPTPANQGAAPIGDVQVAPLNPAFQNLQRPDMASNARAIGDLGGTLGVIAQQKADRATERTLLEIQKAATDLENELYDPQTGVLTLLQGDAVGITAAVQKRMDEFAAEHAGGEGLSHSGRAAVEQYILATTERLTGRAETHELVEDRKYRTTQLEDALEQAHDRVIHEALSVTTPEQLAANDITFEASIIRMGDTITALADAEGLPAERRDELLEEQVGRMVVNRSLALAEKNPAASLKVLEDSIDIIDPDTYTEVHAAIKAAADDGVAFDYASFASQLDFGGKTASEMLADEGTTYTTQFTYNMGPNRPYAPDAAIHHVLGAGVEKILGTGARVEIFSGQEGDNDQHGSTRHSTGGAADVRFFRADGSQVLLEDPEFRALAFEFALQGALGLGAGEDYMGNSMHVDLTAPDAARGQGNVWEMFADDIDALKGIMYSPEAEAARLGLGIDANGLAQGTESTGGFTSPNLTAGDVAGADGAVSYLSAGAQYVLNISDPDIRAKAMDYYGQTQRFVSTQRSVADAALMDDLFTRIYDNDAMLPLGQIITPTEIRRLGTNISAVETYYNSVANGGVATDWDVYIEQRDLRLKDPNAFLQQFESDPSFMTNLRSQLGTTEFKEMMNAVDDLTMLRDTVGASPVPYKEFSLSEIQGYISANTYMLGMGSSLNSESDQRTASELIARVQNAAHLLATNEGRDLEASVDLPALVQRFLPEIGSDKGSFNEITMIEALTIADDKFDTYEDMLKEDLKINGVDIDNDIAYRIALSYGEEYGRAPLPSELLGHMSRYLQFEAQTRGIYRRDVLTPLDVQQGPALPAGGIPVLDGATDVQTDAVPTPTGSSVNVNDRTFIMQGANRYPELGNPTIVGWIGYMDTVDPEGEISDTQRLILYREWLDQRK